MVVPVRGISDQIPNYRERMSSQELSPSQQYSFGTSGFTSYVSESEHIDSEISKRKMLMEIHVRLTLESYLREEKYLSWEALKVSVLRTWFKCYCISRFLAKLVVKKYNDLLSPVAVMGLKLSHTNRLSLFPYRQIKTDKAPQLRKKIIIHPKITNLFFEPVLLIVILRWM